MKYVFYQALRFIKKAIWTFLVAYMLALHNVYRQEEKDSETIQIEVEEDENQEGTAPKD